MNSTKYLFHRHALYSFILYTVYIVYICTKENKKKIPQDRKALTVVYIYI